MCSGSLATGGDYKDLFLFSAYETVLDVSKNIKAAIGRTFLIELSQGTHGGHSATEVGQKPNAYDLCVLDRFR
jgi:hypothetical protein